jgi:hypothetical protein
MWIGFFLIIYLNLNRSCLFRRVSPSTFPLSLSKARRRLIRRRGCRIVWGLSPYHRVPHSFRNQARPIFPYGAACPWRQASMGGTRRLGEAAHEGSSGSNRGCDQESASTLRMHGHCFCLVPLVFGEWYLSRTFCSSALADFAQTVNSPSILRTTSGSSSARSFSSKGSVRRS